MSCTYDWNSKNYQPSFAKELPYLSKKALRKKIIELCKKVNVCPYCDSPNGVVKKCGLLKISHEKFRSIKKTADVVLNKLAEYEEVKVQRWSPRSLF